METRNLGVTGLQVSKLSFGASSLGQEFRKVDIADAINCVNVALDHGINLIDTSPYYGRGLSECLLGLVLPTLPRDRYILSTKLGRYAPQHFDFSPRRVRESIEISLERMQVDYIDLMICHDIEFVDIQYVIDHTLPELRKQQRSGKIGFVGISGYPMKIFREVLSQTDLDFILSYNHYTLQNTMLADEVPFLASRQVGIMNAAPFSARLLADAPLPVWHKATEQVREIRQKSLDFCREHNVDIAKLALQFSLNHPAFATCIAGSANPARVAQWCQWAEQAVDNAMIDQVQKILSPIHNWFYTECLPQNSD